MKIQTRLRQISVLVPENPFLPADKAKDSRCLCALDVEDHLMSWWPGTPHEPRLDAAEVRNVQRMLDWKRVAHIASYLLQEEITDAPRLIEKYFKKIYGPFEGDAGREWPPKLPSTIGYQKVSYPELGDILVHINGAHLLETDVKGARTLVIDSKNADFKFSVIDGQHRINGAYLALKIRQDQLKKPNLKMQLPATIYLDLDKKGAPSSTQAQLFIDVNFNQKKVDRSLVVDLFPTARISPEPLDNRERSHDIARRLMLDTGPLVGMIQIPGIRYGVKDVVTLSTLAKSIEDVLPLLSQCGLSDINSQTDYLANHLTGWLHASGREERQKALKAGGLDPDNVAYQGRILVSAITLAPAAILELRASDANLLSDDSIPMLQEWFTGVMKRAGLLHKEKFIDRKEFKKGGFLGSGGIGRFRELLWAATSSRFSMTGMTSEDISVYAERIRAKVYREISS